ncbi:MAG: hypothetical protein IPN88_17515 [Bacteroidetes bacterium]|nr:hypothetical protein [Bacteroidota bacterium]
MKKILLTICCCAALALNAQTPTFDWAINLGGINYDRGFEIGTDAAGDVYVAGIISGTGDFDPGSGVVNLVSNGNDDMFIAKYTAAGSLVWAYNIGGTGNEVVTAMAIDASGSCYITDALQVQLILIREQAHPLLHLQVHLMFTLSN